MAELESLFGNFVADIVAELTDDKSLRKADRKKLQIINATNKEQRGLLGKAGMSSLLYSSIDFWFL